MTNAKIEARLRGIIAEWPPNSNAHRIAFADVGYPADREEAERLAGFTLLFVAAVSQEPAELPLARVFFRDSTGDFELPQLMSRLGGVEPPDIRAFFGATRFDALYAAPLQMVRTEGVVMANFPNVHREFELLTFPSELPPGVEPIPPGKPNVAELLTFAEREFPVARERGLERIP